jgi:hypothetical protein
VSRADISATGIRVLRGDPDPEELAALMAVLAALGRGARHAPDAPVRPGWVRGRPEPFRPAGAWNGPPRR